MNTYPITRYGHTWTIAIDDAIMETNLKAGEPCEYHMLDWIMANIPRGGIWVDAGANVGNHAIPFALRADLVVCFEPMPQNFDLLNQNAAPYKNILALRSGVGAKAGEMGAHVGGTGHNCQWVLDNSPSDDGWRIPVVTIDSSLDPAHEVRLMKIDVEGMEVDTLNGAIKTIDRHRPEVFVEIWEPSVLEQITVMLLPYGYRLIERWNHAPTYHFSANKNYPVTYTAPKE